MTPPPDLLAGSDRLGPGLRPLAVRPAGQVRLLGLHSTASLRLEKPLTPDVSSQLRDLALLCSRQRLVLAKLGDQQQASSSLAAVNLFICLVARYFDQTDLVDCDNV